MHYVAWPKSICCDRTLVWAVLDLLITHQTNGVHFNQLDRQRPRRMRYEGTGQPPPEEVIAA